MTHTRTAAIIGGGFSGLVAARELALAGNHDRIVVLESTGDLGGAVARLALQVTQHDTGEPLSVDAGAEAFATRSPVVFDLIEDLGISDSIVYPYVPEGSSGGSWLYLPPVADAGEGIADGPGRAVPAPALGLLGIPGDPTAPDVRHALGTSAAARAAEDLTMDVDELRQALETERPVTLAELVESRMGEGVLRNLVTPVVSGVHSVTPDAVDVRKIVPGLLEKTVEHGSLAAGVRSIKEAARPGSAVASLRGGMNQLIAALAADLRERDGVEIHTNAPVTQLTRVENGWQVTDDLMAQDVVLAAGPEPTAQLLGGLDDELAAEVVTPASDDTTGGVGLVTLLIDHEGLNGHPRGTGMLVSPEVDGIRAKAMTHISSKWSWTFEELNKGRDTATQAPRHVVRLSYGRITDTNPDSPGYRTDDDTLKAYAVQDVAALMGLPADEVAEGLVESHVVRWNAALPAADTAHWQRVDTLLASAERVGEGHIQLVGAWRAGTGLVSVLLNTRAQTEKLTG